MRVEERREREGGRGNEGEGIRVEGRRERGGGKD